MASIIEMPKLSDTMTTGTLVKWLKKEGDTVEPGDMLAEVETDKATMEVENFDPGVLLKHYVSEGAQVPIGAPMCAIGEKGEKAPEAKGDTPSKPKAESKPEPKKAAPPKKEAAATPAPKAAPAPKPAPVIAATPTTDGRIKASPLAKKIAEEKGIPLGAIPGSGPQGRIVKEDVLAAEKYAGRLAAGGSAPQGGPVAEEALLPISNMRATIARRLVESKHEVPHFYLETEVEMSELIKFRSILNKKLAAEGIKLTVNDFILKATAEALREVPEINRSWSDEGIVQHGGVQLAFGVAIDDGLLTPVIRDAHQRSLREISLEAKALIEKARTKKLKPEEMTGSTFTVTNLGMFGIQRFYGIVNPPNAGILSIGATVAKPTVDAHGNLVVGQRMAISFSGDHRVVDGAAGARFLQSLKEIIETPALMLQY